MAKPKGSPKTGGRAPGTPNKRTGILEICQEIGLSPFKEMALVAAGQHKDLSLAERRFDAIKELCQYIEPKRKAIEHSGKIDAGVLEDAENIASMTTEQLKEFIKELMKQ